MTELRPPYGGANESKNALYYGDNLDVLRRHIGDETVDLVYLDPPFNSNATYNVLFAEQNSPYGERWRTFSPPPSMMHRCPKPLRHI